ncbi:hypothetical protein SAMN05444344_2647 [Tenacibaculum mesophilum]|uniref:hypothetical protein n=1 Tax=Tenacibaculum mesophilum TaxID=104268 RepID=UPI000649A2EF|nr:hypothetical protein [Tenacibaculum mesophilum]QFS27805.1 hypothetical protein F9Y86_05160 [Tenacibaculum mesophilum]GFE03641.1 hypothetical protein KUL156_62330 [Alteromonas sp. KUL156]SHG08336.1 hypothetical protein SAMN05444344_2647 [Tenacibaculum mesophilum]
MTFKSLKSANLGDEVYIVVKTSNLSNKKIWLNVKQGKAEEMKLETEEKGLMLRHEKGTNTLAEGLVGAYAKDSKITNKDDFKDWAIFKVTLGGKDTKREKEELDKLKDKKAFMYLLVDAHTPNGIKVVYNGTNPDKDGEPDQRTTPNRWLDMDGKWFELGKKQRAPWMEFAEQEYETFKGINENKSPLKERIKDYYHKSTTLGKSHYGKKTEWTDVVSWCASFVNWCFEQTKNYKGTNESKGGSYNSLAFDWIPKNWENGEKCEAFYGAVITLKYSHTAFIVGKNTKKNKYVYLGGNQGGKSSGEQQIRYGTVTIGKEKSISKPKNYKVTDEEKKLKEMTVNADGSFKTTR